MDRGEAIDLLEEFRGQEFAWVDYKQDYHVLGHENVISEFLKDIVSMANTKSDREEHYILVGVSDDGELVGVSDDFDSESGVHHILSLDDAKIQNTISEYLSPTPNVTIYKFISEEPKFGVLVINPVRKKPCIVSESVESGGETYLKKGLIFVRHGSRNSVALKPEVDKMIEERVLKRREDILEGIREATRIGPEAVAKVGEVAHEEEEGATIDIGEEADFVLEERISREPVSDLDKRLNQDISQWATHEEVNTSTEALWEYYSNADSISIDEEAVAFLTQASLEEKVVGTQWLTYVDIEKARQILESTPDKYHRVSIAAQAYAAMGDLEGLETFYQQSSERTDKGELAEYLNIASKSPNYRERNLIEKREHDIGYKEYSVEMSPRDLSMEEVRELIPEIAGHLQEIESKVDGMGKWYSKKVDFRTALRDLEIVLGVSFFED